MTQPPAPTPSHILRSHNAAITSIYISDDNERIYSADSSGRVVITSTHTIRAIASWSAHTSSVLAVQEWADNIVTFVPLDTSISDPRLMYWERQPWSR
jgi:hypothetical protein